MSNSVSRKGAARRAAHIDRGVAPGPRQQNRRQTVQIDTAFFINAAGIAIMIYGLVDILLLRSKIPGGQVGKAWKMLTLLIALFTAGYLVSPFFSALPADSIRMIVSLIFLFGAVYVILTVRLLYRIIAELTA
jgi:hypothetical protein